jgi:hypothetical protein
MCGGNMAYLADAETHERLPKAIKKRCVWEV